MIELGTLVSVVVSVLIVALILGLLWWLIGYVESQALLPPPVFKVIRIVFVIFVVLMLISVLLNMSGFPLIKMPSHVSTLC